MPYAVVGKLAGQPAHKFWPLWSWSDKCHIAFQYTPQLRNFIQAGYTQKFSHPCNARIVVVRPGGANVSFGVLPHRSELVTKEYPASLTDTLLAIKDGTARINENGN